MCTHVTCDYNPAPRASNFAVFELRDVPPCFLPLSSPRFGRTENGRTNGKVPSELSRPVSAITCSFALVIKYVDARESALSYLAVRLNMRNLARWKERSGSIAIDRMRFGEQSASSYSTKSENERSTIYMNIASF
jgi:hypothetical protein